MKEWRSNDKKRERENNKRANPTPWPQHMLCICEYSLSKCSLSSPNFCLVKWLLPWMLTRFDPDTRPRCSESSSLRRKCAARSSLAYSLARHALNSSFSRPCSTRTQLLVTLISSFSRACSLSSAATSLSNFSTAPLITPTLAPSSTDG